ncbi:Salivary acidic proline-rich phosphoprotein 1/2 [Microbotryomycetes sp. JL221]|nr:Salivary acidic proline-rich phosphoprotein 1/2 [Microbotryomycetes sp. JL221]
MGRVATFDEQDEQEQRQKRQKLVHGHGSKDAASVKQQRLQTKHRLQPLRERLPVWTAHEPILQALETHDTIIVLGETGSGKTTQIPHFIMRSNIPTSAPRVACTQPRRVATTSLAQRVAQEAGVELGKLVGYTVRFDDKSDKSTRLKYMTDGSLLAEMLEDRDLNRYDVIVLDEAHERSLRTDMLMGFLKSIQHRRKANAIAAVATSTKPSNPHDRQPSELKIVVMSATIDAKRFSEFFDGAPILFVEGRQHKVDVMYTEEPQNDYLDAALKTIISIHMRQPPGDVLVFLAGQDDIENLTASINAYLPDLHTNYRNHTDVCQIDQVHLEPLSIHPLYARLPQTEQAKAFAPAPPNTRKVILATNVAETSITIPGIRYVIDTGLAKEKQYHASVGIDSLVTGSISQSSALQRTGRAGREANGTCFRLYPESVFHKLDKTTKPEIQRVSLTFAILHLIAAGQNEVFSFKFMDQPDMDAIKQALLTLIGLGAISQKGQIEITKIGQQMAYLPLDPTYARIVLASFENKCAQDVIDLVALLGLRDTLLVQTMAVREQASAARRKFIHRSGDHMTLLNVLRAFEDIQPTERKMWCREHYINFRAMTQVLDARKQLRERCQRLKLDIGEASHDNGSGQQTSDDENVDRVLLSLVAGLFANTALLQPDGSYRQANSQRTVNIHPSSSIHNKKVPMVLYDELVLTTKTYARGVSSIDPVMLVERGPSRFRLE